MAEPTTTPYVFAAAPYANAAPLAHFLPEVAPPVRVIYRPPSQLLAELSAGRADAAMIPVVDLFAHPGLERIEGPGICADGDVRSVLLKCNRPLRELRTVAPDAASRTSNALAAILLEEHFGVAPEWVGPDAPADAEVVIGDRALGEEPAPCGDCDLAGEWKDMTGLPFVFAVWAYRRDHPDPDGLTRAARDARVRGLAALDQLAALHARRLGLDAQRCLDYLTNAIRYDVGPREIEAMTLFRRAVKGRGE